MIGSLIPLADVSFEKKYPNRTTTELIMMLEERGWLEMAELERDDLLEFLKDPQARLLEGRLLYPRYYPAGMGQPDRSTYFMVRDYPRLVFTLISPTSPAVGDGVVIAGFKPKIPLHSTDVIVIGCRNTSDYAPFTDAFIIITLSDSPYIYHRFPESPLQCPLQTP